MSTASQSHGQGETPTQLSHANGQAFRMSQKARATIGVVLGLGMAFTTAAVATSAKDPAVPTALLGFMTALLAWGAWQAIHGAVWVSPDGVKVPAVFSSKQYAGADIVRVRRGNSRGYPVAVLELRSGKRVRLQPTLTWGSRRSKAQLDDLINAMNRILQPNPSRPTSDNPVHILDQKPGRYRLVRRCILGCLAGVWMAVIVSVVLLPGLLAGIIAIALGLGNTAYSLLLLKQMRRQHRPHPE
jgi:hypothetical protein